MNRRVGVGALLAAVLLAGACAADASAAPITWSAPLNVSSGSSRALNAVACQSAAQCLAVGDGGRVLSTENPTGGAGAWKLADVDGSNRLISISCANLSFCVATDNHSRVLTTTHPSGGASGWNATLVDPGRWITGVACPSKKLCAVIDRRGGVVTSTNPAGGAHAWKRFQAVHGSLTSISCPSTKLCVASEANRDVLVSTHPSAGAKAWHQVTADPVKQSPANLSTVHRVSCATSKLCVAVGFVNGTDVDAFVSTNPALTGTWKLRSIDSLPHESSLFAAVSCGSSQRCVEIDGSTFGTHDTFVSGPPFSHWTADNFPGSASERHALTGIACRGTSRCVIVDTGGNVTVGS
jgi:hypothetical protein